MKKLKNPFLLAGYYGPAYFCDRQEELKHLSENIDNERNTVLYSWRRLGKTALLQHLIADLEKQKKAETLYADLLGTQDVNEALQQLTKAVYHRFGKTRSGFSVAFQRLLSSIGAQLSFDPHSGMPEFSINLQQPEKPERSFQALGQFLQKRAKTVVLVLDEFQQVGHYADQNGEAYFRAWMQDFPGIRFIFSGSHRQMMLSMFAEKNRPFYRSAQLIGLHSIELESYRSFIEKHFQAHGKQIAPGVVDEIYRWSRGQTYCIQLICNKLFGQYDRIQQKHFPPVCDEIIEQESPVFYNYSNLLTATQYRLLKAIAHEEPLTSPTSQDFIQKYQLGAGSSVNTALKKLIEKELVIREEGQYYVHDVLLMQWLRRV